MTDRADETLVITRDKRLTRRDLIHDNQETMRREFYGVEKNGSITKEPTSWMSASMVLQKSKPRAIMREPWGTYFR